MNYKKILLFISFTIIIVNLFNYFIKETNDRENYKKLFIRNKINHLSYYNFKGDKVPVVEFEFGTVELYCIDYESLLINDSIIKYPNEYTIHQYRNGYLIGTYKCEE